MGSANETCDNYVEIFQKINYYFRDEQIINGTEFSPKEVFSQSLHYDLTDTSSLAISLLLPTC